MANDAKTAGFTRLYRHFGAHKHLVEDSESWRNPQWLSWNKISTATSEYCGIWIRTRFKTNNCEFHMRNGVWSFVRLTRIRASVGPKNPVLNMMENGNSTYAQIPISELYKPSAECQWCQIPDKGWRLKNVTDVVVWNRQIKMMKLVFWESISLAVFKSLFLWPWNSW